MTTEKSESKGGAKPKNSSYHEKVCAETERDQLKDELARKNEEIEKLTAAILSTREHLSKAMDCLQKICTAASATTNGQHTAYSPKTPNQGVKPPRKLGPGGVLKRSASVFTECEHSESHRPLKRSYVSAPDKSAFQDYSA